MNLKKIIRILFHPTTIKIVGVIGIVGFFFILPTYAQNTTQKDTLQTAQQFLQTFLSLCSRGWVILAILAGKLMTNDFVYGAFIHMDIYLWKIRNIMKNFANFALVAIVMVAIIKSIVGKEALNPKKIITNTLLAGILIQASWFMMGAFVDLSTVATASISAFPMSFLKNNANLQREITNGIEKFKKQRIIIDLTTGSNKMVTTIPEYPMDVLSEQATRENILPNQNSVSGPFIYLGMAVFNFQNYLTTETTTDFTNLTLGFALRLFFLFFFTVGLLLLLIANIMRVGLLWVFIIGSPFLILIQVFDKKKLLGDGGLGKIFDLNNLLAITFKPVIFVTGISLMLIVIVSMQNSIMGSGATRENNLNGVSLGTTGDSTSTLNVEGITTISVNQKDILGKDVIGKNSLGEVQNFFSHLIMLFLTLFLMRRFIKLSLTIGGGTIGKTMEGLIKNAEDMAKSAPVLPFKGSATSLNAMTSFAGQQKENMLQKGLGMKSSGEFQDAEDAFQGQINKLMHLQDPWIERDKTELAGFAKSDPAKFFATSREKAKERDGGVSINDAWWLKNIQTALSNPTKFKEYNNSLGEKGFDGPWTAETPEVYFGKEKNTKALYNLMGAQDAAKGSTPPKDYKTLQNITFYPGEE